MRVWIGCLACYNAGHLVGDWYFADGSSADVTVEEIHSNADALLLSIEDQGEDLDSHEELWIFDVDEAPHESLAREMSPLEAAAIGDRLADLERQHIEPEAYAAYGVDVGHDFADDYVGEFEEAYHGEWDTREDFAMHLAEELGLFDADAAWPLAYIDWERATRDLFMDYFDAPAPGGRIYVFRSV